MRRPPTITTLLAALAIGPAILMSLVVSAWLYFSRMHEVEKDIAGRGQLLAATLAEVARYGVISGNPVSLNESLQGVFLTQPSIVLIEVYDLHHQLLASVGAKAKGAQAFEVPIAIQRMDANFNGALQMAEVPKGARDAATPKSGVIVGYVLVSLTTEPFRSAAQHSLLLGALFVLAIAVITGIASLHLARRLRDPLLQIMAAVRGLRSGQHVPVIPRHVAGELGELQQAITQMCEELYAAHVDLEQQVASRTMELQDAVDAARSANEERRQLIARSNSQLEDERHRIARELHDELGSMIVALRLRSQHIEYLARSSRGEDQLVEIACQAADVADGLNRLYMNARGLVEQLRPEALDALGLHVAISEMIRSFDTLHSDCHFSVSTSEQFPELRGPEGIVAYRVVQEALSNVVRHSRATRCRVKLEVNGNWLTISVADNGCGFNPEVAGRGRLGLLGMQERVASIGGNMAITSDTKGSLLSFEMPMHR